jgi:hypothetical protein
MAVFYGFMFNRSLVKVFYSTGQCFIFQESDLPTGVWNLSDVILLGSSVSLTLKLCLVMHSACVYRIFCFVFWTFNILYFSCFLDVLTFCTVLNSRWSSTGKMLLPLSTSCSLVKTQVCHHLCSRILFSFAVAWELCFYFTFLDVLNPSIKPKK